MKLTFTAILLGLGALLLLALGAGLAVLLAFGLGWLFTQFLPFSLFEASLLSLIGAISVGAFLYRVFRDMVTSTVTIDDLDEWDLDDDDFEDWDDEDELDEDDFIPSIPRWRQERPKLDFSNVGRNEPCPCGSGKKFKHCHGSKT